MDHVREHMRKTYGSDDCLRKDCTTTAQHTSGYCTTHHTEWIHGENRHHLQTVYTDKD